MTTHSRHQSIGRLDHVDGLRAVAILWVAIYHFAYFWTPAGLGTNLTPYGDVLADIPLAAEGYLGVYLFFIVSGFVIAMSLQRSAAIGQFALNRAIRLWPTLIICGTLTFGVTLTLGPAELSRSVMEYLISLTFIPPPHVGKIIGIPDMEWLDGAYWSLWTEVRFYIIAALLYFAAKSRFLLSWSAFALICASIHVSAYTYGGPFNGLSRLLFAEYQPYFSAGIALAAIRFGAGGFGAYALLIAAIFQAFAYPWLAQGGISGPEMAGLIIVFVFAIPTMLSREAIPVLSSKFMVTLGVASYAYYLLHQNLGLSLLNHLSPAETVPSILTMLLIQAALIVVSIVLTYKIEVPFRTVLRSMTRTPA